VSVLPPLGPSAVLSRLGQRRFSRYSICFFTEEEGNFRKLFLHHCVVSDRTDGQSHFFLARSPHCSSSLRPNSERLSAWAFSELFVVEREASIRSQTLSEVLAEHGLSYVDYFKTDSQVCSTSPERARTGVAQQGVDSVAQ
jgi:hypothetical protein